MDKNNCGLEIPTIEELDKAFDELFPELKIPKCECGSDKIKSPIHSTWCPKYESNLI